MRISRNIKANANEAGSAIIDAVVAIPLLMLLTLVGIDVVTIARFTSVLQWAAITAARVGAVETPADGSLVPPTAAQLKLPVSSSVSYLPAYEASALGCAGQPLTDRHRRVLNLTLGEVNRLMSTKAVTATNWLTAADVASPPNKGEMIIVPTNCTSDPTNASFTEWKACATIPLVVLGSVYTCRKAASEVADI